MHSFLIVSKNRQKALDYAIAECKKNEIDKFDVSILSFEKSVGIEDVRNLQKKVILKPFQGKEKAVILESFSGITIEAQNALLKILEEPPANTNIYITTPNKDLLLPTILSRCKIVDLKDKSSELSQEENIQYLNILISLTSSGVGERLKLAQDIVKNKDEMLPWLERMIVVARKELISFTCHSDQAKHERNPMGSLTKSDLARDDNMSAEQYLNILISFQKTHTILKTTNVNPRLALENLFLNL